MFVKTMLVNGRDNVIDFKPSPYIWKCSFVALVVRGSEEVMKPAIVFFESIPLNVKASKAFCSII
jgi:hypothetical protein